MRIRVAIIEQDTGYLEKITNVFNTRYTEQVEIHAFTVMNRAIEFLQSNRVDMILVDEQIEMQLKMFPSRFLWGSTTIRYTIMESIIGI